MFLEDKSWLLFLLNKSNFSTYLISASASRFTLSPIFNLFRFVLCQVWGIIAIVNIAPSCSYFAIVRLIPFTEILPLLTTYFEKLLFFHFIDKSQDFSNFSIFSTIPRPSTCPLTICPPRRSETLRAVSYTHLTLPTNC